jgi:hypothetical protein
MNDMQMTTQGGMDTQAWPQSWDWEEFMFGGKLLRCGYATNRTMVLTVAIGADESRGALSH